MSKPFSENLLSDMISCFNNLGNVKKVSDHLGTTYSSTYSALRRMGIDTRLNGARVTEKELSKAYYHYISKKCSVLEAAIMFGTTHHLLTKYIKSHNLSKVCRKTHVNIDRLLDFSDNSTSYLIGLICADGNIRRTGNVIRISLQEKDQLILEKLREIYQPEKKLYYCNVTGGQNQYAIDIVSRDFKEKLGSIGIHPNKSLTLKYPDCKELNKKMFIRGYVDGDGHISRKAVGIIGTKDFLEELRGDYMSITGNTLNVRYYHKKYTNVNILSMYIRFKDDRISFLRWLYSGDSDLYIERKYQTAVEVFANEAK